jgi:hypothetical protein
MGRCGEMQRCKELIMTGVKLENVVDAFDGAPDAWETYLNRTTGECVTISDDDEGILAAMEEEGDQFDDSSIADWQKESAAKALEVKKHPDDWIKLPRKFEFHEYRIIEQFCDQQPDGHLREILQNAIHGKGAFRRFKDTIHRLDIQDAWYAHRRNAIETFMADWLTSNGISFS